MSTNPLGQSTEFPQEYSPEVLFAMARADSRSALGIGPDLPFHGFDVWNAWELSWLDETGKPVVATATITVDADSPNLIESKSLKLYFGSLAMSAFGSIADVERIVAADLGRTLGADVRVRIEAAEADSMRAIGFLPGRCVDDLDVTRRSAAVNPDLLTSGGDEVEESLHTHLLRSLCPVTGQPDYGSVLLSYEGPRIEPASFLEYVVSFRQHNDFHEACVERMFVDILERCSPGRLTVYARYTRRGGIDINPFRSNFEDDIPNVRLWRQ